MLNIWFDPVEPTGLVFLRTVYYASTSCLCPCGAYLFIDPAEIGWSDIEKIKALVNKLLFQKKADLSSFEEIERAENKKLARFNLLLDSDKLEGVKYYSNIKEDGLAPGNRWFHD